MPRAPLLVALILAQATPAAGQSCAMADGAWAGLVAGAVAYEVGGETRGLEWGASAGVSVGKTGFEVGYHRAELTGAVATPHMVRGAVRHDMVGVGLWRLCAVGHGGASSFSAESDRGTSLAGGVGVGVVRPVTAGGMRVTPFLEARGLGARSEATILDMTTATTGASLGMEAGVAAALGRARIRLTGSLDGFAAGLGATPYPARALRLAVGYRF